MEQGNLNETEIERERRAQGVRLEMRQLARGQIQASLGSRVLDRGVLYYSEINLPITGDLAPPPKSVCLLAIDSREGALHANGHSLAKDGLLVIPPDQDAHLVTPGAVSTDTITIPEHQFLELAEVVNPELQLLKQFTVARGDPQRLGSLRQQTRMLLQATAVDAGNECFDNLVAEWISSLAQADTTIQGRCSVAYERRARIARRARDFFAGSYAQPVLMADVCKEVGVGLRTMQRCFADYFQMTPKQYLKVLRFNKARHALLEHDATTSSVTYIAIDCGFHHFGRFAVEYRNLFGELPRDTLRRG